LSAAEDESSPAAARLVVARCIKLAWLKTVGTALLIAIVPLQGHARNVARDQQGLSGAPPSGLLAGGRGPKGTARETADAGQQCLCALAYVLSPPPATRGMMPDYLPTISPKDAQPIPPVAADTLAPRSARRQAARVRRSHGQRPGRCRQGAQQHLAASPRPLYAQRAGSCRQQRSARHLRRRRHRLLLKAMRRRPGAVAPRGRSALPHAAKTRRLHLRTKLHSANPIEQLSGEIKLQTGGGRHLPNENAIVRLDVNLAEQSDEWAVQCARYMTLKTVAPLSEDPTVTPFRPSPADLRRLSQANGVNRTQL
jgi:hypothetical protein